MSDHPIINAIASALQSLAHGVESVVDSRVVEVASNVVPPLKAFVLAISADAHMADVALEVLKNLDSLEFKPADWDSPVRQRVDEAHKTEG